MIYTTKLLAVNPLTQELCWWDGPRIQAISFEDAEDQIKDRGYLIIDGQLIEEIDIETGIKINYENLN